MAATITKTTTDKVILPTTDEAGLPVTDGPRLSTIEEPKLSTTEVPGLPPSKYLCLTILGYRKPGMSEEAYRLHMNKVSAPMTKDLMVKYGVKRWTVIHNPTRTRTLMNELYDRQMSNVADYDCFSQVVFESVAHYKRMKEDPYYQVHLFNDHENFADTKRSQMTIGWIEEWINEGAVREGLAFSSSG